MNNLHVILMSVIQILMYIGAPNTWMECHQIPDLKCWKQQKVSEWLTFCLVFRCSLVIWYDQLKTGKVKVWYSDVFSTWVSKFQILACSFKRTIGEKQFYRISIFIETSIISFSQIWLNKLLKNYILFVNCCHVFRGWSNYISTFE